MLNPLAPPAVQGIPSTAPAGYVDVPFNYVYNFVLTAGQTLLQQITSINTDADFFWRGLVFDSDGTFSIRFQDGEQYYLSSDFIMSANLTNSPGDPFPIVPEVYYPAGGRIVLDIQDESDDDNTGQILFLGVARFRLQP